MFLHFVIQRPNGDRLISSPNPEELCSKTQASVCCAISFWQVQFSGWFRSIGRISLWTHNNTGWRTNVMAPRNRRSLWFFLLVGCDIFGMDACIYIYVEVNCGTGWFYVTAGTWHLVTKTDEILASRRYFQGHFLVIDVSKVRLTPG